jgi:hypothetical protein
MKREIPFVGHGIGVAVQGVDDDGANFPFLHVVSKLRGKFTDGKFRDIDMLECYQALLDEGGYRQPKPFRALEV